MSNSPWLPETIKLAARRRLAACISIGLRLRSRPLVISGVERWLVVAPHQDDETLGCGGLIHARRQAALPVHVLFLTDGSASHPGHPRVPPVAIADLRRAESTKALHLLGVQADALHFINAADGTLAQLRPEAANRLVGEIAMTLTSIAPTVVFLPCGDDGSSEHDAAFVLVRRALAAAKLQPRLLEYPIWSRWSPRQFATHLVKPSTVWRGDFRSAAAQKTRSLAVFTSQTEPLPPWTEPALPRGFAAFFASGEEFFFER